MMIQCRRKFRRKRSAPAAREELGEYQLYTVAHPTTIANQQTKQVGLFEASGVKVTGRLEASDYGYGYARTSGDGDKIPVRKYLTIDNTEAAGLGMPMPKGMVRVYKADSKGRSQFVGEDAIDHTPKNEKADLLLGESFDVTVRRKVTNSKHVPAPLGFAWRCDCVRIELRGHGEERQEQAGDAALQRIISGQTGR